MSPQPKKRAAKPQPEQLPADLEPADNNDDEPETDEKPDKDHDNQGHDQDTELKIVVKPHIVEIDLPRDGNETDTLERIATLLDEL